MQTKVDSDRNCNSKDKISFQKRNIGAALGGTYLVLHSIRCAKSKLDPAGAIRQSFTLFAK